MLKRLKVSVEIQQYSQKNSQNFEFCNYKEKTATFNLKIYQKMGAKRIIFNFDIELSKYKWRRNIIYKDHISLIDICKR